MLGRMMVFLNREGFDYQILTSSILLPSPEVLRAINSNEDLNDIVGGYVQIEGVLRKVAGIRSISRWELSEVESFRKISRQHENGAQENGARDN